MGADSLFPNAEHKDFPVCTQVTLVHGVCDSRCITCPVGRVRYGDADAAAVAELGPRRHQLMRFDLFRKVADEIAQHPHAWLRLHARGEPLLHPNFAAMVT